MSAETTKTGLFDRIMVAIKDHGDEKTVKRVLKKVERILGETIYNAEKEIERLKEQLEDKKEDVAEAYVKIDPEVAKGNEEAYARDYLQNVRVVKSELADLEESLEGQQDILKAAQEELSAIK